jgi:hypothetical protein
MYWTESWRTPSTTRLRRILVIATNGNASGVGPRIQTASSESSARQYTRSEPSMPRMAWRVWARLG